MTAYISMDDGLGNVKRLDLRKPVTTLGRQADNDFQVLGASVSRRHAEIVLEDGAYFLIDKQSKTGSFVNDEPTSRHRLRHGDRIRLGAGREHEIQFQEEGRVVQSEPTVRPSPSIVASAAHAHAELQNLARFLEVNQALKISLGIDDVLQLIVDAAIEITRAERGAILLRDDKGNLELRVARDCDRRTLAKADIPMSHTVLEQVYRGGRSLILAGVADGVGPIGSESIMRLDLRTIVCIPMVRFQMSARGDSTGLHTRETLGVLYVDSRQAVSTLTKASVTLLETLAFEASKALESVRQMELEAEKKRLDQELEMAREVQDALLGASFIDTPTAEIQASSTPCRFVAGDFFDLFNLGNGRVAIVLGDVSGKGIAAALLAAMAQGVLRTEFDAGLPTANSVNALNRLLIAKSSSWRYLTLFCGILEPDGRFEFVNGGHCPPLLIRATGEVEQLFSGAAVVGILEAATYSTTELRLNPGDVIVAVTDGVTEATGTSGEMFGDERLEGLVKSVSGLDAPAILAAVLKAVADYSRGAPQHDDITVVVLKMK